MRLFIKQVILSSSTWSSGEICTWAALSQPTRETPASFFEHHSLVVIELHARTRSSSKTEIFCILTVIWHYRVQFGATSRNICTQDLSVVGDPDRNTVLSFVNSVLTGDELLICPATCTLDRDSADPNMCENLGGFE